MSEQPFSISTVNLASLRQRRCGSVLDVGFGSWQKPAATRRKERRWREMGKDGRMDGPREGGKEMTVLGWVGWVGWVWAIHLSWSPSLPSFFRSFVPSFISSFLSSLSPHSLHHSDPRSLSVARSFLRVSRTLELSLLSSQRATCQSLLSSLLLARSNGPP